ncbi:MAG: glycerate kinase [Nitrospirae bacterium]|nr:glycerate kinase [Magnetococcales bacterium]HAT50695.1 glycerate kinase [Alphaproteobacteria bacterium]
MLPPVIVIAPDGFKGCMSSLEAAQAIEFGLQQGFPELTPRLIPMADGGEGTVAAMVAAMGGELRTVTVSGPVPGMMVDAVFGLVAEGRTAIMEMASASGIALLPPGYYDPMGANTLGTGEMIRAALNLGVEKIILGLGGSASTDGGTGMARGLGAKFLDRHGHEIALGGGGLVELAAMDLTHVDPRISQVEWIAACDVSTGLCGPQGAAQVFGPQKGATPEMIEQLDLGLHHLAQLIDKQLGLAVWNLPGSGAAGGLGGGVVAFLGGRLQSGAALVAQTIQLQQRLLGADLVITGEGRLDGQSLVGKAPGQVAQVAKSLDIPVIAICGIVGPGIENIQQCGIDAWFAASPRPLTPEEIPLIGPSLVTECARQIGTLLKIFLKMEPGC